MPVPADDRGQAGVDRHAVSKVIQVGQAFDDHWRAFDIPLQPVDRQKIVHQPYRLSLLELDRVLHVCEAIQGDVPGIEAVPQPVLRTHHRIDQHPDENHCHPGGPDPARSRRQRWNVPPAIAASPAACIDAAQRERSGRRKPPGDVGRCQSHENPGLQIELEHGIHPADVAGDRDEVHAAADAESGDGHRSDNEFILQTRRARGNPGDHESQDGEDQRARECDRSVAADSQPDCDGDWNAGEDCRLLAVDPQPRYRRRHSGPCLPGDVADNQRDERRMHVPVAPERSLKFTLPEAVVEKFEVDVERQVGEMAHADHDHAHRGALYQPPRQRSVTRQEVPGEKHSTSKCEVRRPVPGVDDS